MIVLANEHLIYCLEDIFYSSSKNLWLKLSLALTDKSIPQNTCVAKSLLWIWNYLQITEHRLNQNLMDHADTRVLMTYHESHLADHGESLWREFCMWWGTRLLLLGGAEDLQEDLQRLLLFHQDPAGLEGLHKQFLLLAAEQV